MIPRGICCFFAFLHQMCTSVYMCTFRTGRFTATGDGSVKDIICISAIMKSCYFATTLNLSMAIEIQLCIRLNTLLLCCSFLRWPWVINDLCGQLLGVSLGLNCLFYPEKNNLKNYEMKLQTFS